MNYPPSPDTPHPSGEPVEPQQEAEQPQSPAADAEGAAAEDRSGSSQESSAPASRGSGPLAWWKYQRQSGREGADAPPPTVRSSPGPRPPEQKQVVQPEQAGPPGEATAAPPPQLPAPPQDSPVAEELSTAKAPPPQKPERPTEAEPARKEEERRQGRPERKKPKLKSQDDAPVVQHTVPPPSRRDALSADLEEEINQALGDASLDEILSGTGQAVGERLEVDSRLQATVLKVHRDSVFFSLSQRHEGMAPLRQFAQPPEPGQQMEVVVKGYSAEEGLYEVAVPGASIDVSDWSDLTEGALVEARITGSNTGGLECLVNNIRGFIPISQVSLYRVEDLSEFVDQKMQCLVVEADSQRRNLVLSRRAVLEREQEESRRQLLEELEVGQTREGVVRNIRDFGAFVDLGGVDGLVHVSQLSWDRIKHPNEVLTEGQKVRVKVDKIDRQTGKISLSYRDLLEDPWADVAQKYPPGALVSGTVTRLADFGAFVKLGPGIEGLVHISELAHYRVRRVNQVVQEGQEVQVKILSVDQDAQRISLSLKAAQQVPEEASEAEQEQVEEPSAHELAVPKRQGPLRGGTDRSSGGDQFGLKW